MLREDLETRIGHLLERAVDAEAFADGPSAATLALVVEQRINDSIERLVFDVPMRGPVRARPSLAERWPLCVSMAKPDSDEARTLLRLWQLETGRTDAPDDAVLTDALTLINAIEHQVNEDRRRAAMAIDAGKPHHDLVSGMRDMPKDGRRKRGAKGQLAVEEGRVEILAPGHGTAQLRLPLACLNESILETLREWRGSKGLRHWAAMQRLLSVEGGRMGRVVWKVDEHLEALGYGESTRRDPSVREAVVSEVKLLARMELAVFDKDGKLRLRKRLFTVVTEGDRLNEETGTWVLEGLELEIHPLIYDGVRDPKTGKLGTNHYPQTIEVAKIDDVRFPYTHALGLVLPMRWRWDWKDGRDHCALSGANLLNASGIEYAPRRAVTAWRSLRNSLDELQRVGALGRYTWEGEPWTLGAICRLCPPQWAVDRTVHQLAPVEKPVLKVATTGKDLRDWRQAREWKQVALAEKLGVTDRTIRAAEAKQDVPLTSDLAKRLRDLVEAEEAAQVEAAKMASKQSPAFVMI